MKADLVLEGGGVKGTGLVGAVRTLEDAGYTFPRVAGTSAGSIVGALVAAGLRGDALEHTLREVDYRSFADGPWLTRLGPVGKGLLLLAHQGIYRGDALHAWLCSQLDALGVRTFGDLRADDPDSALAPERSYRLVVVTTDLSRGRMVRLPWDYPDYGLDPDTQLVADAVRASMAIPYFYRPVKLRCRLGTCRLVDGGVLSNFPIDTFDRRDGRAARWPTYGIKLSARPETAPALQESDGVLGMAVALVRTMLAAHDARHLDDPGVLARTMFVDTFGTSPVDFDLDEVTRERLYRGGREAAARFLRRREEAVAATG